MIDSHWAIHPAALRQILAKAEAGEESAAILPAVGFERDGAVGVVHVVGPLFARPSLFSALFGGANYETLAASIASADADPCVESIRLSVDCRYQRLGDPVVDRALMPSLQQSTWEALYQGWDDDEYKYYWKDLDLDVVPFDLSPFDKRDLMAIDMGFQGDARARSALVGVVHRHRDPAMRERAAEALAHLDGQTG